MPCWNGSDGNSSTRVVTGNVSAKWDTAGAANDCPRHHNSTRVANTGSCRMNKPL